MGQSGISNILCDLLFELSDKRTQYTGFPIYVGDCGCLNLIVNMNNGVEMVGHYNKIINN
jgi:hypothetical protein